MEKLWLRIPISASASEIFMAVVVLPLPLGPESSTMGQRSACLAMVLAVRCTFSAYCRSHSSRKALGSVRRASLISVSL